MAASVVPVECCNMVCDHEVLGGPRTIALIQLRAIREYQGRRRPISNREGIGYGCGNEVTLTFSRVQRS